MGKSTYMAGSFARSLVRWRADYNHRRPYRALSKQTLAEYAEKCEVYAQRRMAERMKTTGNIRKAASIIIAKIL